jgi:hypothetical protein
LDPSDLDAWRDFYDSLQGWNWVNCPFSRDDPCATDACSRDDWLLRHVSCAVVRFKLRIVEIRMNDNAMRGWFPRSIVKMDALRLLSVAVTSQATPDTTNVFFNRYCIYLPRCYSNLMACNFRNSGGVLCDQGYTPGWWWQYYKEWKGWV